MSAPSVLEYARFHGLAVDHTSEDLLENLSPLPLRAIEDGQLLPDPNFSVFADNVAEPKLQLTRWEGSMLAESIRNHDSVVNWSNFLPERHRVRNLKVEEPLLAGDHESDVRRFRREASSHVDTEHLFETCSLISSASEQDFEDEWNDIQSGHALREVEQELEDERCNTTKEALLHLSASLKDPLSADTKATILHSLVPAIPRARSLTPLLMPESPVPQAPSSPDLDFSLRSEEDIERDSLLLQLEREMQEKDQIPSEGMNKASPTIAKQVLEEIQDATQFKVEDDLRMEAVCASLDERRQARKDLENLQLDVSMILSTSASENSSEQGVELPAPVVPIPASRAPFSTVTAPNSHGIEIQPNPMTTECAVSSRKPAPLEMVLSSETRSSETDAFQAIEDGLDDELIKFCDKAEKDINARLKGDKISKPEECLKQPVPPLDPFFTRSPCDSQDAEPLMRKLAEMCLVIPNTGHLQGDMKLNWSPFPPRFTKLDLVDNIGDDSNISRLVRAPQGVIRSEQLLWKSPGVRILDTNDESDGEIEQDLDLHEDMSKPVEPIVPAKRLNDGSDSSRESSTKSAYTLFNREVQNTVAKKTSRALNGFSTSNALEAFLDLRGGKFKKAAPPQPPSVNELADDPIQATQFEEEDQVTLAHGLTLKPSEALAELNPYTIQVPSTPIGVAATGGNDDLCPLMDPKWPKTILVETAILGSYRSLVNFLETNGGNRLNIIYREMTKSDRSAPHSASPDIILNPQTALMFTNLQALHQKNLPGQGMQEGQGMVQSRVLRLAQNYTQLFILVTMTGLGNSLLQSQIDTLTTFSGFCANISGRHGLNVHPLWVSSRYGPHSVETALNRLTWNLACCHGFPDTDPSQSLRAQKDTANFINEETLWEQF
ncbi:uncharacterized protein Z520_02011 [Fonsecaea multimorphosa CBS 102226]|uniref:DUF7102 domain-containing protein n=1 Tax=Fonsecaea multimorphosa CBS 102226 TaxID=1442371 RepID=A0A0D2K7D6_9EURO|nr:uncharacterized protein Z520_02011 [Fonsecaea multimorphosa CBS 102226]KIY01873.1 hypothetical protein Z520_02011 [Fonsecaea multimorphosa CBS 102226]